MNTAELLAPKDRRHRRLDGFITAAVTIVAVPTLLLFWAPWQWVVGWAVVYAACAFHGIANPLGLRWARVEMQWSVLVGLCVCFVPISAALWSDYRETRWIVALIVAAYIAIEASWLPHLGVANWRLGPSLALPATAISLLTMPNFGLTDAIIIAGFLGVSLILLSAGGKSRERNVALMLKQRELEEQIRLTRHLADHDSLTGVLNRRGITSEIERSVAGPATVVMFDLNRFKSINDTNGHSIGDALLVQLATQLVRRLGDDWHVGRLGGDEFVAVSSGLPELPPGLGAPVVCSVSNDRFSYRLEVGLSGGVVANETATTVDSALAQAGFAMKAAKRHGGGLAYFAGDLQGRWERGLEVGAAVNGEDPANSIVPYAQTIVRDGHPIGCEVLARWRRPDGTIHGPDDFMPLLVEEGLMPALNRLMIEHAMRFAATFNDLDDPPFVSVNVTAHHIAAPDLISQLVALTTRYDLEPGRLMLEITESERLGHIDWEAAVADLRAAGVMLAIDDLGAGYSSMERMASLPITHLKFDMAFAQRVNTPFGEVMRGLARYAHETGVEVIAEGIESDDQVTAMADLGISTLQGYLYSRPAPLETIAAEIRARPVRLSST